MSGHEAGCWTTFGFAPSALLIYVAESHQPEAERRARAYAAQYYTAKPLDPDRTLRVLESFLHTIVEREDKQARPGSAARSESP